MVLIVHLPGKGDAMGNLDKDKFSRSEDRDESGVSFESELRALVVVAHPDDETLWVGGTMLMFPDWSWKVVSLCRGKDRDRRPRFFNAMSRLGGLGSIGDVDDGPDQHPLSDSYVQETVISELEKKNFDVILTHSPFGEYTRHLRHEEVGRAVLHLWQAGELIARELWMFAYTDSEKTHYPRAIGDAHLDVSLPEKIWKEKLAIIQDVYGFAPDSWEAMTTPKKEAFWRFHKPDEAHTWQKKHKSRMLHESVPMSEGKGEKK